LLRTSKDVALAPSFEARFDEAVLTAHMMVAAARALPGLSPGAHSLRDLPMSALWAE
jgi:diaminopimelate dehydrogenase